MKLVDNFDMYVAGGSNCYLCGCDRHEGETSVIDLDRQIDMEGSLMICLSCANDLAALIGCSSQDTTARHLAAITRLEVENAALRGKLQAFEDRILEAIQ